MNIQSTISAAAAKTAPIGPSGPDVAAVTRFVVPIDGTILRLGHACEGAGVFLRAAANRTMLISTNSRDTARTMRVKLKRAGIDMPDAGIVLAGEEAVRFIARAYPHARCLVAASRVLTHAARLHGLQPVQTNADVVLLGRDSAWTYQRLMLVINEVARGAVLVAANADCAITGANLRIIPDTGAILAAIEAATGRAATHVICPSLVPLMEAARARLGSVAADTLLISRDPAQFIADPATAQWRGWQLSAGEGFAPLLAALARDAAGLASSGIEPAL